MEAEFDTVAAWTADVALDLGPEHHVPAGCRGSGSPAALDWLIERMELRPGALLLDSGAGVGGPAAYAAQTCSARPVLVDPETGACRAAKRLFGHPVVRAVGSKLPMPDSTFDAAWSLGVLCTTPDQLELLAELRRTVRPGGRIGVLTFVAHHLPSGDQPEGNHFPTVDVLSELVRRSALRIEHRVSTAELAAIPENWAARVDTVTSVLAERYGATSAWRSAEQQSSRIERLLDEGSLTGELLVLRR